MTRLLVCAFMVVLLVPQTADAALWDRIKELSGPGPSIGTGNGAATLCVLDGLQRTGSSRRPSTPAERARWVSVPCVFLDTRTFVNAEDDNFPNRVQFRAWDFGLTWKRADGALEIGAGAGFMRFHSPDSIGNRGEVTTTRFTFNVPRFAIAPVLLVVPQIPTDGKLLHRLSRVLKVYGRINVIPGRIDATDFGVPLGSEPGQSTFSERHDVVWSHGVIIDLGELIWPLSR